MPIDRGGLDIDGDIASRRTDDRIHQHQAEDQGQPASGRDPATGRDHTDDERGRRAEGREHDGAAGRIDQRGAPDTFDEIAQDLVDGPALRFRRRVKG